MEDAFFQGGVEKWKFCDENRLQVQGAFSTCERVAKSGACGKSGRSCRQDLGIGKMVGSHFQEIAWICNPVNLVENNSLPIMPLEKGFGIFHIPTAGRDFAIDVSRFGDGFGKSRLANPPRGRQPNDRALFPELFDEICPEWTDYHQCALAYSNTKRK